MDNNTQIYFIINYHSETLVERLKSLYYENDIITFFATRKKQPTEITQKSKSNL